MAEAQLVNGKAIVAYKNGVAIDSEGVAIPGAPKQKADTDPSKQPGAIGASTPEERMGLAIARAMMNPKAALAAHGEDETDDEEEIETAGQLTLDELPAHLATLATVDEVKAFKKGDKRVGAKSLYAARIAELEAAGTEK